MVLTQNKVIVVTGATGAFGEDLIESLLAQSKAHLVLLVRGASIEEAQARLEKYRNESRVEILRADLSEKNMALSELEYSELAQRTTHILHAADSSRFNQPIEEARKSNVETTQHILNFALSCSYLERFGYVSTALVAGKRSGIILENEFEHGAGFLNTYQQSKYEAEALVRTYNKKLPIVIFRPPLLISPFNKESKGPTNLLTLSIFLARKGFLPILPGSKLSYFDIMDGEVVARTIASLLLKPKLTYTTYHITSGDNTLKVGDIISIIENYAGEKFSFEFTGSESKFIETVDKAKRWNPALQVIYNKTASFLPELAYPKQYNNEHTLKELNISNLSHNAEKKLSSILS